MENKRECCDDLCEQGRYCPNRKGLSLDRVTDFMYDSGLVNLYYRFTEKFTLMEWLAWLAAGFYLLSHVIW
jgi:hypothetical protein